MPAAQVRAQLPQTFPISPSEISALRAGGVHLVTLREEEGFTPHREVRPLPTTSSHAARITVGSVTAQPTPQGIHLAYRYTGMVGAPNRSHRPPIELEVATGRRARVAYNGRFSGYSIEWLYKLSVITVAVGIAPEKAMFTTAPHHNIEDLAELF